MSHSVKGFVTAVAAQQHKVAYVPLGVMQLKDLKIPVYSPVPGFLSDALMPFLASSGPSELSVPLVMSQSA